MVQHYFYTSGQVSCVDVMFRPGASDHISPGETTRGTTWGTEARYGSVKGSGLMLEAVAVDDSLTSK